VPAATRGTANPKIVMLMLCAAVAIALGASGIRNGVFDAMSTDDAKRLVEVRDLIAGQGWFGLTQYRLDPPGLPMHWSRVIDAPLAAMILMLRPFVGMQGAEAATLVLWPLLFGATLMAVAAIARRMSDDALIGISLWLMRSAAAANMVAAPLFFRSVWQSCGRPTCRDESFCFSPCWLHRRASQAAALQPDP
jgi:hypothetical protein